MLAVSGMLCEYPTNAITVNCLENSVSYRKVMCYPTNAFAKISCKHFPKCLHDLSSFDNPDLSEVKFKL